MSEIADRAAVLERAEKAVLGEIWTSSRAYDNLVHLCDWIGDRFAGSESERQAAEYLIGKAREYGVQDVATQEFQLTGWTRGPVRLEVTEPVARQVAAIALPYTPAADLEGVPGRLATADRVGARARTDGQHAVGFVDGGRRRVGHIAEHGAFCGARERFVEGGTRARAGGVRRGRPRDRERPVAG